MKRSVIFLVAAISVGVGVTYFVLGQLPERQEQVPDHVYVMRTQAVIDEGQRIDFARDIVITAVPSASVTSKTLVLPETGRVDSLDVLRPFDTMPANDRRVSASIEDRLEPPRLAVSAPLFAQQVIEAGAFVSQVNTGPTPPQEEIAAPPPADPVIIAQPPARKLYTLTIRDTVPEGMDLIGISLSAEELENRVIPVDAFVIPEENLEAYVSGEYFADKKATREILPGAVITYGDVDFDAAADVLPNQIRGDITYSLFVRGVEAIDIFETLPLGNGGMERVIETNVPVTARISNSGFEGYLIEIEDSEDENLPGRLAAGINAGIFTFRAANEDKGLFTNRFCIGETCYERAYEAPLVQPEEPIVETIIEEFSEGEASPEMSPVEQAN